MGILPPEHECQEMPGGNALTAARDPDEIAPTETAAQLPHPRGHARRNATSS